MEKTRVEKPREYDIPNKLYFRIGEVSDLVGVKPYVLRYWESEFSDIKPSKSKSGQRLYKRRDVEMLLRIRELLYEERFTINGARKRLREFMRSDGKDAIHLEEHAGMAPELSEEEGEGPRQLEVFSLDPEEEVAEEVEDAVQAPRPRKAAQADAPGAQASANGRDLKTYLKIRKDLEELLQMFKG